MSKSFPQSSMVERQNSLTILGLEAIMVSLISLVLFIMANLGPLLDKIFNLDSRKFFQSSLNDYMTNLLAPLESNQAASNVTTLMAWFIIGLVAYLVYQNIGNLIESFGRYKQFLSSRSSSSSLRLKSIKRQILNITIIKLASLFVNGILLGLYFGKVLPESQKILSKYVFSNGSVVDLLISVILVTVSTFIIYAMLRISLRFENLEAI